MRIDCAKTRADTALRHPEDIFKHAPRPLSMLRRMPAIVMASLCFLLGVMCLVPVLQLS